MRTRGLFLLGLLSLLVVLELFLLQRQVKSVEVLHYHQNAARKAQLTFQEVASLSDALLNAQEEGASQLLARMQQHSHHLQVVGNGGRAEGTSVFLEPLSRLPRISFDELEKNWKQYSQSIQVLVEKGTNNPAVAGAHLRGQYQTMASWYDRLIADLDQDLQQSRGVLHVELWVFALLDVLFLFCIFYLFNTYILKPLKRIESNTRRHEHTTDIADSELGNVSREVNDVIEQLRDASEFVRQIGEGNLTLEYTSLDKSYEKGKNKLADSLIEMQFRLRELGEEDRRRRWVNEGLTRFVEILRSSDADIVKLGDRIMSTLTQYTRSNQGSLYLLNDEDAANPHLELVSLFAFDIKKYESRSIKLGEGLLGQTFLERQTTYLTRVPDDYIRITSGLGEDNPRSLLIVPLKLDQHVFGVVELASFNLFEEYEISFVEKLGESIASTLSNVRSAQQTKKLLDESKSSAEMMRAQEEEMRQNMEELQATQEEMARKERDYLRRIDKLEKELAGGTSAQELAALRNELASVQASAAKQIRELEEELSKKPAVVEGWKGMEELDRTLRVNLEAVKIAHETLKARTK